MKNLNGYSHKIILQKFNELFSFVRVASLSIVFILAVSIFSFTLLSHTFASNVTEEIGIKYSLAEKYTDIIYEVSFTATNNQTTVLDYYTLTIPQTEISADSLQCNGRTQKIIYPFCRFSYSGRIAGRDKTHIMSTRRIEFFINLPVDGGFFAFNKNDSLIEAY